MLTIHGPFGIDIRALADLVAGKFHAQGPRRPIGFSEGEKGNQHLAAEQPVSRLHDHITDGPGYIVKIKLTDFSDITISCPYCMSDQTAYTMLHKIPMVYCFKKITKMVLYYQCRC